MESSGGGVASKIETAHECDEGNIKGNMGESNVVARQVDNERKELQSLIDKRVMYVLYLSCEPKHTKI